MVERLEVSARSAGGGTYVDRYSNGGVGGKAPLVLPALIATQGVAIPVMEGGGLADAGGIREKHDSIPDFRSLLSLPQTATHLG